MKKAEDFRKAFGPATPGFESVVKKTMKELRAQEVKPAVKEWRRWRRPVFAMAMALVLFVGFVAVNGTLNPFSQTDRIRSEEENLYTAQPITTVLSMGAGQEEGNGNGAESGMSEGENAAAENDQSGTYIREYINNFFIGWAHTPGQVMCYFTTDWYTRGEEFQEILGNKKPVSYQIEKITGQEGDPVRQAVCIAEMEDGQYQQCIIDFRKNDKGVYSLDPESLKERKTVEAGLSAEKISLAEADIIKARLDKETDGLSEKLIPINLTCEKKGIHVELVSGLVTETDYYFVISFQDLEGKYADYDLGPTAECNIEVINGITYGSVYRNEAEHRSVYFMRGKRKDVALYANQNVRVGVDDFRVEDRTNIDLIPLLKQYGKTVDGVAQPELERAVSEPAVPKNLKVLDYTQPLDIPLLEDVSLSGIGWIDDQLHIQYHTGRDSIPMDNGGWYSGWSVWNYGEKKTEYSPLRWDSDGNGKADCEEYIFDIKPDQAEDLELGGEVYYVKEVLNEGWMFKVPLLDICTEGLKANLPNEQNAGNQAYPEIRDDYNRYTLWEFFCSWAEKDADNLPYDILPEQRVGGEKFQAQMRELLDSGKPLSYQINGIQEDEIGLLYDCTIQIDPGNGGEIRYERASIHMKKRDGFPLIDLDSLAAREPAEYDPAVQTISLSGEAIMNDRLDYFYSGIRGQLKPIGVSCETNGIRMELISGLVKEKEAWYVYSLEDLEGVYEDYSYSMFDMKDTLGEPDTHSSMCLYRDRTEHKAYFIWNPQYKYRIGTADRVISLKTDCITLNKNGWTDIIPLLKQYGTVTEGIRAPENTYDSDFDHSDKQWNPEEIRILDYTKPLDIPLMDNISLTGIGWVNDQLHVQICSKMSIGYGIIFNEEQNGTVYASGKMLQYSPLWWIDEIAGTEYLEYIFDYKPEDVETLKLTASMTIGQKNLKGSWKVDFPLNLVCESVGPAEELDEDFGNISLDEREGRIVFDVRAQEKVYTNNEIGYALREDGTAEAVKTSIYASYQDEIIIPEQVNGHVVTTIGTGAFMGYSMMYITLPETVQAIRSCAFEDCDKLVFCRIPEGVKLTAIEDSVFYNCISLEGIVIPDSVTVIGDQAFYSCRSLQGVIIPKGTVSIGDYAFLGCEGMPNITLPVGLENLGSYAFSRCIGLEAVDVPGSVTYIGQGAFKDCTGLQIARIREGIIYLSEDTFAGCGSLEIAMLPESMVSIGDRAFKGCGSLKKIVLPENLTYIGRAAFMDCTGLEELVIPESVTAMEENVFKGCTGLTCTVKDGSYAMQYCKENGIPYVVK